MAIGASGSAAADIRGKEIMRMASKGRHTPASKAVFFIDSPNSFESGE
jgi:hypothetical protein